VRAVQLSPALRLGVCAGAVTLIELLLFAFPLAQLTAPIRGGDGPEYLRLASNLVHHGVFSDSLRAPFDASVLRSPGYPALLAGLQAIGLGSLGAIRVVQLVLLGLTAWVTGLIALRIAGERAGRIAAVATAAHLPLVWATTEQMTETAGALGIALLALLLLSAREPRAWVPAGLALAATAYVRPTLLALAVPVAILIAFQTRRLVPAAVFAATVAVAIAPWAIRTSLDAHTPVALQIGTGAGRYASAEQNLGRLSIPLEGNGWIAFKRVSRETSNDLRRGRYTPVEQAEFDARMKRAAPHVPVRDVVARLPARMRALWGPIDATPPDQRWTTSARLAGTLEYWLLAALVCAFVALRRRSLLRVWPLWLPAIYLTLIHTVIHVESRYSLPARPGLIVMAAVAAAAARGGARRTLRAPDGLRVPQEAAS